MFHLLRSARRKNERVPRQDWEWGVRISTGRDWHMLFTEEGYDDVRGRVCYWPKKVVPSSSTWGRNCTLIRSQKVEENSEITPISSCFSLSPQDQIMMLSSCTTSYVLYWFLSRKAKHWGTGMPVWKQST